MASNERPQPRFRMETVKVGPRAYELRLSGALVFRDTAELWRQLRRQLLRRRRSRSMHIDLAEVTELDGAAAALLKHARSELRRRNVASDFQNARGPVKEVVALMDRDQPPPPRVRRKPRGIFDQLGLVTRTVSSEARALLGFIGELTVEGIRMIRQPRTANLRDLAPVMERAGADGVPIVALISFLVGLVSAAQAAAQLEKYGANMFVADLVGISMARELGPLMTAIVVTGRSGAAFAAEIGTMKVSEEIDALRIMGLSPVRFLVAPRMLGLLLVLPLLVLFANAFGSAGGLVVAVTRLEISAAAYLHRIAEAVRPWDVGLGLSKSALFALAIGAVSCQQGFATRGGAAAVGHRTTAAVVGILFLLILIDAAFAIAVGATGL